MKRILFLNYESMAKFIGEKALDGDKVCAVLHYDEAKELVKELLCLDEISIGSIELEKPEYDGYKKEYYITVDDELELTVEEAWHEDNEYHPAGYYLIDESHYMVLISGDADSRVIKACERAMHCYEFSIDELIEEDVKSEYSFEFKNSDEFLDLIKYLFNHLEEE